MAKKQMIVWFEEVTKDDVGLVGGKGANLGEMTNAHLPIPYGFVVTSDTYFKFIESAKLTPKIKDILSITNVEHQDELHKASTQIRKLIIDAEVPAEILHEIVSYYGELPLKEEEYFRTEISPIDKTMHVIKSIYKQPVVAVRSSATAEDLPDASFAGQQETYLNVQGETSLLKKVKECWASLFTERAIYYREQKGFDHFQVGLAAVVQRMVQSDKSGIAFSIDPVTNDKSKIVIESIFGLGEYIVQGKVTPDHYEVDKNSFVILNKQINYQNLKMVRQGRGNTEVKLSKSEGKKDKLNDEEIIKTALLVKSIEDHYYFPQDIEWAIEGDRVYIVQSRPITTLANTISTEEGTINTEGKKLLTSGAPASPGVGVGEVKILHSPTEIDKIKKGDILVAPQTNPDFVPAMKRAAAIVTDKGGRTSHAAIVSRELGIPAVVGTEDSTKVLKDGMTVSVIGSAGEVYEGKLVEKTTNKESKSKAQEKHEHTKTVTRVYVNLAESQLAKDVSKYDVDGVGLLRAEFMIADMGVHPREFIRQGNEKKFISNLTKGLAKFAEPFSPRPVVYRATDFKSNEYRNLKGGSKYEPKEENPMIGYRGASRYIVDEDVFALELQAIRNIWEKGHRNLHLMIPFVRVPYELIQIKEVIRKFGLLDFPEFKLWMMVEVPAAAIMLPEFIKIGIDGVSIGTNDLTMMLLGVDRDSEKVANVYDERNPAVMQTLAHIVESCKAGGITCSICGQAASDYPELVSELVKRGITSVSVNPDVAEKTRKMVFSIEKELHIKKK
ncbi:MAG: phosphoenolpyruvate synthase [Patescibacteria group bacterium]